jgi:hypothetical protein
VPGDSQLFCARKQVGVTQSDNKLLCKRGKKAQRKVKKASSLSQATPYTLPPTVSPIGAYIHAKYHKPKMAPISMVSS